jgi:hypothetical protein
MEQENLKEFTDLMVDIETGGTNGSRNPLLQIAARPFNLATMQVSRTTFDRCLQIPKNRHWDEGTRNWWNDKPEKQKILREIMARAEWPLHVMEAFHHFGFSLGKKVRFWSNHTLDWDFIEAYFIDHNVENPFKYYNFRDLYSVIHGIQGGGEIDKALRPEEDVNQAHNAMYDVDRQIQWLMNELVIRKGMSATPVLYPGQVAMATIQHLGQQNPAWQQHPYMATNLQLAGR